MSAAEMYDYLPGSATADYNSTLSVTPQNVITEAITFKQTKLIMDDTSYKVSSPSTTPIFIVTLEFNVKNTSDIGTIYDFFSDDAKAYGLARSFKWSHEDGHTYIVKFWEDIERTMKTSSIHGIARAQLIVIDRVDDA